MSQPKSEYTSDQIEVLNEISKQIDKDIIENLDEQFEQERIMTMYENGLNTW